MWSASVLQFLLFMVQHETARSNTSTMSAKNRNILLGIEVPFVINRSGARIRINGTWLNTSDARLRKWWNQWDRGYCKPRSRFLYKVCTLTRQKHHWWNTFGMFALHLHEFSRCWLVDICYKQQKSHERKSEKQVSISERYRPHSDWFISFTVSRSGKSDRPINWWV